MTGALDLGAWARTCPREELLDLAAQLGGAQAVVLARLATPEPVSPTPPPDVDERIDTDEAARRLGRSASWLRKNARRLPFTIQDPDFRCLRFSARGIERHLLRNTGPR